MVDQGIGIEPPMGHHAVDAVVHDDHDAVDTTEPARKGSAVFSVAIGTASFRAGAVPVVGSLPHTGWHRTGLLFDQNQGDVSSSKCCCQ